MTIFTKVQLSTEIIFVLTCSLNCVLIIREEMKILKIIIDDDLLEEICRK